MGKVFTLAEQTFQRGTDYDIVMLYQLFLGRNPESSHVIMEHRSKTLAAAFRTFLTSDEFRAGTVAPARLGQPVHRHDTEPVPTTDQLDWLFEHVLFDEDDRLALRAATSWESFFAYLLALDGFLDPQILPPEGPAPDQPPAPEPLGPPLRARVVENAGAHAHPIQPALATVLARLDRLEALIIDLGHRLDALHPPPVRAGATQPAGGKESAKRVRQAR